MMDFQEGGEPPSLDNAISSQEVKDNIQSIVTKYYSDLKMKTVLDSGSQYCDKDEVNSLSKELKLDFSPLIGKPFYVTSVIWNSNVASNTILPGSTLQVPADLLSNTLAKVPFQSSAYWRGCVRIIVQVHGTPMHLGTIIVAAHPTTFGSRGINSDLCAPHIFLSANTAAGGVLEVPFYYPARAAVAFTDSSTMQLSSYTNVANVSTRVLNALGASTSASTSISLSYYALFTDLEFYVPHQIPIFRANPQTNIISSSLNSVSSGIKSLTSDFIDRARGTIRQYTGLHNPNVSFIQNRVVRADENFQNIVDSPTYFEKIDPYSDYDRVVREETFNTSVDEMMLSNILRKPQLVSVLTIQGGSSGTVSGSQLACFPMTPFMVAPTEATRNYPIQQKMHAMSTHWRGNLKLIFQSAMTNFQFFRIQISRDYAPTTLMTTMYPEINSVANLPTSFLEFSAGGQIQEVVLPYESPFYQLPCTVDPNANAAQHGLVYIHLTQAMTFAANSPTNVSLNVYLVAEPDFQFYGYNRENIVEVDRNLRFEPQTAATPYNVSIPRELVNKTDQAPYTMHDMEIRPIVSVRDHLRRFYKVVDSVVRDGNRSDNFVTFRVRDLLFQNNPTPLKTIIADYNGFVGGLKLKIYILGISGFIVRYFPPSWEQNSTLPNQITATNPPVALGAIGFSYFPSSGVASAGGPYVLSTRTPMVEARSFITDDFRSETHYAPLFSQAELVIPHLSPYKFTQVVPDVASNSTENDLGYVVLSPINETPWVQPQSGLESTQDYRVQIYVSTEDNFRLGHHIRNFPFQYTLIGPPGAKSLRTVTTTGDILLTKYNIPAYYRRTLLSAIP